MAFAAFDTLEFVKTLEKSGIPAAQAEAISVAVRKSHEMADLATKADLREYESAIRGDLEKLEMRLDAKHESLRKDLDAKHESLHHEIGDLRKEMKEVSLRQIIWLGSIFFLVVNAGPILPKLFHLG